MSKPLNEDRPAANAEEELVNKVAAPKKQFVEPEITAPVDVLEATTFFQAVDSGATRPH